MVQEIMKLIFSLNVGHTPMHIHKLIYMQLHLGCSKEYLERKYRGARPSTAKRIEKKIRKIDISLSKFYVKL
jgi:hypothetical protein